VTDATGDRDTEAASPVDDISSADAASSEDPGDGADPLARVRAELASIDELPLEERVERFGQINAAIVAQLAELDEL
jgi:hypothetical protein